MTSTTSDLRNDASPAETDALVDRFLAAVAAGRPARLAELYADDATVDATVPGWRSTATGRAAIANLYVRWFADPATFEELDRLPTSRGVVLTYLLAWEEFGVPHAAHHCHVLTIEAGRIVADKVFCGGRWPANLLADMEAARHGR